MNNSGQALGQFVNLHLLRSQAEETSFACSDATMTEDARTSIDSYLLLRGHIHSPSLNEDPNPLGMVSPRPHELWNWPPEPNKGYCDGSAELATVPLRSIVARPQDKQNDNLELPTSTNRTTQAHTASAELTTVSLQSIVARQDDNRKSTTSTNQIAQAHTTASAQLRMPQRTGFSSSVSALTTSMTYPQLLPSRTRPRSPLGVISLFSVPQDNVGHETLPSMSKSRVTDSGCSDLTQEAPVSTSELVKDSSSSDIAKENEGPEHQLYSISLSADTARYQSDKAPGTDSALGDLSCINELSESRFSMDPQPPLLPNTLSNLEDSGGGPSVAGSKTCRKPKRYVAGNGQPEPTECLQPVRRSARLRGEPPIESSP